MKNHLKNISTACCHALQTKRDWFWFLAVAFLFFALFVIVPVVSTPGNDILFQLSILKFEVYVLMIGLSLLNALVVMMYRHIRRVQKANVSVEQVGSGLGALASGLLATIGCGACYSSILALFGLSGSVFIVEHRWWFAAVAGLMAIWAIDSSAEKIVGGCKKCQINIHK